VALHYLRGAFMLDVCVVFLDWVLAGGNIGILRVLRAARVVRLVRLLKLKKILAWIQDHINSEYTSLIMDFVKLVFFVLLMSHFVACLFYHLGTVGDDHSNWLHASGLKEKSLDHQYFAALYWGLTSLLLETTVEPQSTNEYLFCIAVVVMGLVGFSTIVSRITTLLLEIQNMRADTTQELWKLRRYFRQNCVPVELGRRIVRYLEYNEERKRVMVQESELPLLETLTPQLRNQLHYVGYMLALREHPLFRNMEQISDVMMHRICENTLREKPLAKKDALFFQGEVGLHMTVVVSGEMLYSQKTQRGRSSCLDCHSSAASFHMKGVDTLSKKVPLGKNTFLGEHVLWVHWRYCGDAYADTECNVISLDAQAFGETIQRCPYMQCYIGRYAQRVARLLRKLQSKSVMSDVTEIRSAQHCWDQTVREMTRKRFAMFQGGMKTNASDV